MKTIIFIIILFIFHKTKYQILRISKNMYIFNKYFLINLLFQNKKLITGNVISNKINFTNNKYIPKIVHCTYNKIENIPKHVIQKLKNKTKGYKLNIYDDNDCKKILKKINPKLVNIFENLKVGAHKADIFRYCVLYLYGGVYLDIKSDLVKNLDEIIDHNKKNTLYSVLMTGRPKEDNESELLKKLRLDVNVSNGRIYQGFIATYPGNKIFIDLIHHFVTSFPVFPSNIDYFFTVNRFYDLLRMQTSKPLYEGLQFTKKYGNIILFCEINKKISENEQPDRYGAFYKIYYNEQLLINTRYVDFPW